MTIKKLEITGYKGFSTKQTLKFSIPNGKDGSGLTYLTGANNSGKSSIIEVIKARNGWNPPSFAVESRNSYNEEVLLTYIVNDKEETIKSNSKGSSETSWNVDKEKRSIFVLPSRRAFNPVFGNPGTSDRDNYIDQQSLTATRPTMLDQFSSRLFSIQKNPIEFNKLLKTVLGFQPQWAIDLSSGGYFLKFYNGKSFHNSDGLGEGIVSIFSIIDALYDSKPNTTIVIDEPELSLHPTLQKRLFNLLKDYAKDRQIIIATHSTYFIDPDSILNGATLVRVVNSKKGTEIIQITERSRDSLRKLASKDTYNPHVFGLNTKEIFFQEDGIIVVEGQEDVVCFPDIEAQLNINFNGSFFGWGAGGAEKIEHVCNLLEDLGFKKVAGILDGDKKEKVPELQDKFKNFKFFSIPADDVRFKKHQTEKQEKEGLLDTKNKLLNKYRDSTTALIKDVNKYLSSPDNT